MGSTGHGLWSSCDWWILIRFVCFCISRFVSCNHNFDWWQWKTLLNFGVRVFVKSAVKWNGYEACYTSLWYVLYFFFACIFVFGAQLLIIAFLSFWSCKQIKTSQQFLSVTIILRTKNHNITCGHCCFLAFHKPVSSHRVGYKSGKSTQRIISLFKT